MKTFLFLILIGLGTAAFAAPFGSLVDPGAVRTDSHQEMYLINQIAAGSPVSVCVDGRLDKYSLSKEQIDAALNSWFKYAYQTISKANREPEFEDLLPILSKGADIRLQNCANISYFQKYFSSEIEQGSGAVDYVYASAAEDLRIILVENEEVGSQAYTKSPRYILWNMEDRDGPDGLNTLRHELGHILSLADQYQQGRVVVSKYGTSDIIPSMMHSGEKFTCDDADGLIFTLDCISRKNLSRGGEAGWRSFCPQRAGRNYAYCKTKNRENLLWVNGTHVTYAHYNPQGDMQLIREWRRPEDAQLLSLYPQGIPGLLNLETVHKDKDVSYQKSRDVECAVSTRAEPDGNVFPVQPGETLVACAASGSKYAVPLIQRQGTLVIPSLEENGPVCYLEKRGKEITATGWIRLDQEQNTEITFVYTPEARFEYYRQDDKMLIFMFPKDSAKFYLFFDGKRGDVPSFAGSAAALPEAKAYPVLDSRPVAQEVAGFIRSSNPLYLIYHNPDRPRNHRGDYCVTNQTLPANFIAVNQLGRDAWDLHTKYRRFFEGTIQNWMPGSVSDGFAVSAEREAEESARNQLTKRMGGRHGSRR